METKMYQIVEEQQGGDTRWFARVVGGYFVDGTMTSLGAEACKALLVKMLSKTETVVEEVEL